MTANTSLWYLSAEEDDLSSKVLSEVECSSVQGFGHGKLRIHLLTLEGTDCQVVPQSSAPLLQEAQLRHLAEVRAK